MESSLTITCIEGVYLCQEQLQSRFMGNLSSSLQDREADCAWKDACSIELVAGLEKRSMCRVFSVSVKMQVFNTHPSGISQTASLIQVVLDQRRRLSRARTPKVPSSVVDGSGMTAALSCASENVSPEVPNAKASILM